MNTRNQEIIKLHKAGVPQADIAREFGITRQRVHQILSVAIGDTTPLKKQEGFKRDIAIAFLQEILCGKDAKVASELLDLSYTEMTATLRSSLGMNLHQSRFYQWGLHYIGQRFNDWTILHLRCDNKIAPRRSNAMALARCELCKGVFSTQAQNIIRGHSRSCFSCSIKKRKYRQPLVDTRTGNYFVSHEEAAAFLELSTNQVANLISKGVLLRT